MTNYFQLMIVFTLYFIITFIIISVFWNLGSINEDPIAAYTSRSGYLLMTQMIITFSSFNVAISVYIPLKKIFQKDNHNKIYGKYSFYIASLFYLFPFFVVVFSIIINLFYWLSDLNKDNI